MLNLSFYRLCTVYQTFIGAMNNRIKRQIAVSNPFVFKHISNLKVSCLSIPFLD